MKKYFITIITFLMIFSFFNDNYFADVLGPSSLKLLYLSFILMSFSIIIKNLKKMTMYQDKIFFIYFGILFTTFLIQNLYNESDIFLNNILTLISILLITLFFSFYNLKVLLYSIWITMMISVIICYFNDPISQYTFRTSGGTGDPNEFATQLLIFILISIFLFKENNSKIFIIFSLLFFLFGIFMAGSKSSFLTLAILILIVFIVKYKYFINIFRLIIVSILILVSIQIIDFKKITLVNNVLERTESSGTADQRFASWIAGKNMFFENPTIGIGFDQFLFHTKDYAEGEIDAAAAHNILVKLLAESGIIVFILFLYYFYIIGFKQILTNKNNKYFILYLSSIVIFFMGQSLSINYDKYFLLTLAILMNLNRRIEIK